MKTMLELVIRLQELGHTADRVTSNPQLTRGEKAIAHIFKTLVRECLPPTVLVHYDNLEQQKPELSGCPEVFAMAVLVSAYESQTPGGRRKLAEHFQTCSPAKVRHRPSLIHDRESQKVLAVPPICDPVQLKQALHRAPTKKR